MTEVTKGELAKQLGVSGAMVSKHVKSGVLDKCFTPNGKKIYLEKAIDALEKSRQRGHNESDPIAPSDGNSDSVVYTGDNVKELDDLLKQTKSPSQKVQVMRDFWTGKLNRQKFMAEEGELIPVSDAKAAVEALLSPLNQYMDDQANNLKNHFPDVDDDVIEWIDEENNRQKEQLRRYKWES